MPWCLFWILCIHHSIDVKIEDLHLRAVRAGDESGVCQARRAQCQAAQPGYTITRLSCSFFVASFRAGHRAIAGGGKQGPSLSIAHHMWVFCEQRGGVWWLEIRWVEENILQGQLPSTSLFQWHFFPAISKTTEILFVGKNYSKPNIIKQSWLLSSALSWFSFNFSSVVTYVHMNGTA